MSKGTNSRNHVTTTRTSFKILELILELEGGTMDDIAEQLEIAPSTAHRHLNTLHDMGYLVKEEEVFHLAVKSLVFGDFAQHRKEGYVLAKNKVDELAKMTDERVQFIIEEHGQGVYVFVSHGGKAVRNKRRLGKSFPLHVGAAGKVILAHKSEEEVDEIIDKYGLSSYTENTVTSRETLFREIERAGRQGHSYNREELIKGLNAVAVPIVDPNDKLIGTFAIGGPSQRLQGEYFQEQLPQTMKGVANEIELNLEHMS